MNINIVNTEYGKVEGIKGNNYFVWKGIPYAKPPIGEFRFKKPEKPDKWTDVFMSTKFGNRCYQMDDEPDTFYGKEFYSENFTPPMSEDCLYLNIWTPDDYLGKEYPVALWIHGGAYMNGHGGEMEFDGVEYCKRNVILVTVNYRMGVYGFFAHKNLHERDGYTGNYAIYDLIAAIDWIQENISNFGGNPDNITIFGQSAGAQAVQTLVSIPSMNGKVAKAIIQSGGGYNSGIFDDITPEQGCVDGQAFLAFNNISFDDICTMPSKDLNEYNKNYFCHCIGKGKIPYEPIQYTELMHWGYDESVENKACLKIPYMIGCTNEDIYEVMDKNQPRTDSQFYNGLIAWCTEMEKQSDMKNYTYYFKREPLGDTAGAFHSSELWYIFGTLERSWRPKEKTDYDLSNTMIDAWTNFMKSGNPNGGKITDWKPCNQKDLYVKDFDVK